ncbi:unnamed protein product, partial [Ectocarpus sp. 8 AP-2014]
MFRIAFCPVHPLFNQALVALELHFTSALFLRRAGGGAGQLAARSNLGIASHLAPGCGVEGGGELKTTPSMGWMY